MSISIVQQIGVTGNASDTASVSFTNPTTAGNLVLVGVANEQFFLFPTISDGVNTYTLAADGSTFNGGVPAGVDVEAYYCVDAASCQTITVDNSSQGTHVGAIFAYEISGVSAYDTASNGSSTGGTASCSLTTSQNGEMIYVILGSILSGNSVSGSYVTLQSGSCGSPSFAKDAWLTNAGTAGSNTITLSSSGYDALVAVAFKPIVIPRLRTLTGWGL